MDDLLSLPQADIVQLIGEDLILIEEQLGLPAGSPIGIILSGMSRAIRNERLFQQPARRWFGTTSQLVRAERIWTTQKFLMERQLEADNETKGTTHANRTKIGLQTGKDAETDR